MKEFRVKNITGPWTPEAWQEEVEGLSRYVRRCFEAATTQFAPPSEASCLYFADRVMAYLPNEKAPLGSRELLVKHGRAFLKHLAQQKKGVKLCIRAGTVFKNDEFRKQYESTLFHMGEAERHVADVLKRFSYGHAKKNDSVRYLGELVQDLWKETNGGRTPRSRKPDGPVCRVLVPVLEAIHRKRSPASVSEAFRGRR